LSKQESADLHIGVGDGLADALAECDQAVIGGNANTASTTMTPRTIQPPLIRRREGGYRNRHSTQNGRFRREAAPFGVENP
jgi:hypothetical protein